MPPKPKAVLVKETGEVYESARVVAEAVDGDYSKVYRCLRGERKTHKGYTYEYVEEDTSERGRS